MLSVWYSYVAMLLKGDSVELTAYQKIIYHVQYSRSLRVGKPYLQVMWTHGWVMSKCTQDS